MVRSRSEARALSDAGYREIRGDLIIELPGQPATLRVEGLEVVRGTLRVTGNRRLQSLAFPDLVSVGSLLVYGNGILQSLELPSLEQSHGVRDGGMIMVASNGALSVLRLPELRRVGNLTVALSTSAVDASGARDPVFEAPRLVEASHLSLRGRLPPMLQLSALETVGFLSIEDGVVADGANLRELALPALREAYDQVSLNLQGPATKRVNLGALQRAGRLFLSWSGEMDLELGALESVESLLISAESLQRESQSLQGTVLALPSLVHAGDLTLWGPSEVQSIALPALRTADRLELGDLPQLRALEAEGLEAVQRLYVFATGLERLELTKLTRAQHILIGRKAPPFDAEGETELINPELHVLSFPVLESLDSLTLYPHPRLPACPLDTFFPRLDFERVAMRAPAATCVCEAQQEVIHAQCEVM